MNALKKSLSFTSNSSSKAPKRGKSCGVLDDAWIIGGKFEVQSNVAVWNNSKLNDRRVCELTPGDNLLLLKIEDVPEGPTPHVGLVLPQQRPQERPAKAGWVPLEAGGDGSIVRRRLDGSWAIGARYRVKNPIVVRDGKLLDTRHVCEMQMNDEIVVLELDVSDETDDTPRLRAKVSRDGGFLGWISPETTKGEHLLDPLNLLGMEVVEIYQKSRSQSGFMKKSSSKKGDKTERERISSCVRSSCMPGTGTCPWKVGGHYRVLEVVDLRESEATSSKEVAKVPAGTIVNVVEIPEPCGDLSAWLPIALVTVELGGELKRGWIQCAGKDNRDRVDTRDQHEFEKVTDALRQEAEAERRAKGQREAREREEREASEQAAQIASDKEEEAARRAKLEREQREAEAEQAAEAAAALLEKQEALKRKSNQEAETEDDKDRGSAGSNTTASENTQQKATNGDGNLKLQDLEIGGKDDKQVDERTSIQDDSVWCNCRCGRPESTRQSWAAPPPSEAAVPAKAS